MKVIFLNSFSLSMLHVPRKLYDGEEKTNYEISFYSHTLEFTPCTLNYVRRMLLWREVESYIGHEDTARVVGRLISAEDKPEGWLFDKQRRSYVFNAKDIVFVAQYVGPRLPEGATELPQGATLQFWMVGEDWHQD